LGLAWISAGWAWLGFLQVGLGLDCCRLGYFHFTFYLAWKSQRVCFEFWALFSWVEEVVIVQIRSAAVITPYLATQHRTVGISFLTSRSETGVPTAEKEKTAMSNSST